MLPMGIRRLSHPVPEFRHHQRFFMHPGLEIDAISPVFFIPVAGLVVMPVAGTQICAAMNLAAADMGIMI